ncbi:MAG: RuBisCO large subunit C-terminal-like domain-containing protein, partial [Rhodobacteraceae bacterium]|nr:RuBisCO large subunit C-terminal-like domain-containing protein [Paracoccaceae bacterium]
GIDFIKDDELQADGAVCPFEDRVRAVMPVIRAHAERSGKTVMYAFNLTGEVDEMRARHDLVLREGGTCVMASANSVGLTGLLALRRHAQLPIHLHRNGWGYLSRHPALGFDYAAWSKLWRLAGADHMHVNGLRNKFCEADESVIASARSLLAPLSEGAAATVMPVFASGQTALQAFDTWAALRRPDLIFAAGGGIMGHPDGPAAGVRSLRDAWDAAMAGLTLEEAVRDSVALKAALRSYG